MPFHPRNAHQGVYDLEQLVQACPELAPFLITKKDGQTSLDFGQAKAVFWLNKALLQTQYNIYNWSLPKGALCPPIPSRADYLHHLADLLAGDSQAIPKGKKTKILDIGTGANCIYPLLGAKAYGWSFVGSDINLDSIQWAHQFLAAQPYWRNKIELRLQKKPQYIFEGIIQPKDKFAASICNPPFFGSAQEALAQQKRKWKQLHPNQPSPNFGGQAHELYCKGGELAFIQQMIKESSAFGHQVQWFTSLVSQEKHLQPLYKSLKQVPTTQVETITMQHGNKKSRVLCWRYK
jgi:23S rRNA (adenine1618-N6)-methyltransferase